tara:strand:- start:478 stop:912 length:435 start_codon:yes stop_codon:yes gene_type:complete
MKKFSIYCGYDILIMGADEDREIELEVNFLLAKPTPKILNYSGKLRSLDATNLDMCLEEEGEDYKDFLERTDEELKKVGDNIEYNFNNSEEGEINHFLSAFFLPRYDKLLILDNEKQDVFSFVYQDSLEAHKIHSRKWELKKIS